jgi:transglutaminase-like putative cysteine protease
MILEIIVRLFYKIATPSFFIFWLLVGVISSVAFGLSEMVRGLAFRPLFWLSFVALSVGWLLARTRLKTWLVTILLPLLGVGMTYFWVSKLLAPTVNFFRAAVQIGSNYFRLREEYILDSTAIELALSELSFRTNSTWMELQDWLGALSSDQPGFQAAAVLFVWGVMIWIVAVWAGWVQKRYDNAIVSIFPGATLLVATLGYTYEDSTALLPFLIFSLLLIAVSWLNLNETHWKSVNIDYPDDARLDSIFAFSSITIVLVATAFFLPRLSIRRVVEMVREYTSPQIEQAAPFIESFGVEPFQPSIGRFAPMLTAGMPRNHLIGAGPELSEQIVMSVQITDGLPPGVEADSAVPLYWRGLTYDQYTGIGWDSSDVSLRHYRSNQQVGMFERPGYWIIEQEVNFIDQSELLFAAGDLISVDENYRVAWRSQPWLSEIEQFPGDFFGASMDEASYRAQSFVPVVDETALRSTARLYPDWIRENYILVPIDTPQRVINLTFRLIDGVDNPYDRALIIEQYLRQYEYTTDLPSPPSDRDVVDYFLFDLKKGYCDYFASAMVVMARAAGLPARLVVGYSRGTYDSANDRYVISEAEAHSWPEVYFAGVGWVPFEPTSGRKEITRSETPLEFPGDPAYVVEAESLMGGIKPLFGSWPLTFVVVVIGLIWFGMVWITVDEWLLKRLTPAGMTARLYERLYRHGRGLGAPAKKEDTPYDFATSLRRQLASLAGNSVGRKSMRQARGEVRSLANLYTRSQFGSQALTDDEKTRALSIWQRLRRQLIIARVLYWLKKLRPKNKPDPESETME